MRMSRPGWPGSMPSPALLPPPALNSIAYRRYLRYLPEYRTRRRAEEPRRAQTSGEQRQDDDDDDEEAEEEEEEEGKGEEKVLGEKEARQGSVGEWGEGAILPDVSVNSLVRQYTDMLHARTTDIVVPRSVSRSCSSIPTAADCRRAAAAAPSGEEQPEEEQPRKTSLDSGGGWAPHFPRYRSLSLPWPSDPWWRWRGEPSLACQDRASGGCAGGGAPPPHACSLSRLDSATSDEGCPGDDVSAGPSPLPSPDCRAAHRLSGLITPFRSLSPASSLGSHLGSIEDLPLVRSMSAGHVLDSFRRSHSADSAVEVDEAASPRVSPLNDDPGVAEDGLEAAEEAQDGGGDGERSFCECAATCDDVYGEADVRDEQPVQFRRKSDDANIVSAGRRHGAVNVETLLRRVRGCGVVGCGQRQEAQRGGVLRTPSVVISDHSGDTVSLTVALASSDFSLSHLDGLQHSASSPSLCLSAEDPASRKVSSCSSCSSVSTVDLNTPLTLTPIPLEGLLRDSILPEETARRISSCSTCSYISNSEDEVEQVLTRPPPPRKPSNWRKVRNIVQWTPFIQTYKKHKYPWVQLAGHQGNFRAGHKQGTILKKLCPAEEKALEAIMKDILRPYVPRYSGVVEGADGEKYLQLEDLLSNYSLPCVMDIKMGVRTYLEDELAKAREKPKLRKDMYEKMIQIDSKAPTEAEHRAKAVTKPRYMVWRETISSTATQGFRIEGVRRGDGTSSKDFKTTRTREQVLACLSSFLQGYPHVASRYVQQLKSIKMTLEASPFFKAHELIGSSLLFVHNDSSALVRMIDFAKTVPLPRDVNITHRSPWSEGTHEDGYLLGLDNLIDLFSSLQKTLPPPVPLPLTTPNGTVSSNKSPLTPTSPSISSDSTSSSPTSSSSSSSKFSSSSSSFSSSSSSTISTSASFPSAPSTSSTNPAGPGDTGGGGGGDGGGGVTPEGGQEHHYHHSPLSATTTTTTTTTTTSSTSHTHQHPTPTPST